MSNTEIAIGGWTTFTFEVSPEAKQVFQKATERWQGVDYTPMAVATQVVNGINYCFLSKGVMVTPERAEIVALVYIHQPSGDGDPFITEIKQIKP
ncbi:MAG TPA: hypothetical protein DCS93_25640 [Microscillaceae bacterium]|nr:hypothetical protein [Microscillaceae bacterium]